MDNNNKIPSITSLHKERQVKESSRADIFNVVLNRIIEKITYTNRHTDKTYIIFEVPQILIGYPSYDMKSCILFIINKLSEHGYIVEFVEPFYLYIDWGSRETSKNNTITQKLKTAVPSANPDKLKLQTKALLSKFPNTSKIEFVYEDTLKTLKKKKKKR